MRFHFSVPDLPVLAAVLLLGSGPLAPALFAQSGEGTGGSPVFSAFGGGGGADWRGALPDPVAREVAVGRHWHASLAWEDLGWEGSDRPLGTLARAQVLAGWRNWAEVARVLEAGSVGMPGTPAHSQSLYLLARAKEELEDFQVASDVYRELLGAPEISSDQRAVILVRLARSLARAGRGPEAALFVGAIPGRYPFLSEWSALEVAEALAESGDTASVLSVVAGMGDPEVTDRARGILAEALLAAGDTVRAVSALDAAVEMGGGAARTGGLLLRLGEMHLALGDTVSAEAALARSLEVAPRGGSAPRSAQLSLSLGPTDPDRVLELAEVLARGGEPERAIEAYDRWESLVADAGERRGGEDAVDSDPSLPDLPLDHRSRRARALVAAGDVARAADELAYLGSLEDAELAAPAIRDLARLEARRGRRGAARALEDSLIARFPVRREAVSLVFFRGDDRQDAGDFNGASDEYRRAVEMSPSVNEAGLARMRLAQIHFHRGRYEEAARVFEGYLGEFPEGRRWDEAAYWAGRSRLLVGDTVAADLHLDMILTRTPISYYSLLASELRGVPFGPPLLPVQVSGPDPVWVEIGVMSLDLIRESGLDEAHSVAVERLVSQAGEDPSALLALGEALNSRGITWRGINLGWAAKRTGLGWDERILKVIYPFPDREAVQRAAEDRALDPFVVAGLIRQESAFWPEAVSSAGAVGLMQVMPATGAQLARSLGPSGFTRATLFSPEVNVHLGSAFLADLIDRFGPELPFVLSAYNAGPTRMNRWSAFPETEDPVRFTERVPFAETRGYLKAVQRNAAIYRWLYSEAP